MSFQSIDNPPMVSFTRPARASCSLSINMKDRADVIEIEDA